MEVHGKKEKNKCKCAVSENCTQQQKNIHKQWTFMFWQILFQKSVNLSHFKRDVIFKVQGVPKPNVTF